MSLEARPASSRGTTSRGRRWFHPGGVVLVGGALALAAAAWNAADPVREERASGAELGAAVETVRTFVTLASHLRGSGGDERFAERIPAEPGVLAELEADLELGQQLGDQDARLVHADVKDVRPVARGLVEVRTREYWVTEGDEAERANVLTVRYVLRREWSAWKVADWDLDLRPEPVGGTR
jgi:hypothetical protein